MAFIIKDPPEFTTEVTQWNRETAADGVEMAKDIEKLLNNDVYLKENMERSSDVSFPASGWSSEAPYTQTVTVTGMQSTFKPIPLFVDDGTDRDNSKARKKAYACITYFDSGDGTVTATCKYDKPQTDCTIRFKGV